MSPNGDMPTVSGGDMVGDMVGDSRQMATVANAFEGQKAVATAWLHAWLHLLGYIVFLP